MPRTLPERIVLLLAATAMSGCAVSSAGPSSNPVAVPAAWQAAPVPKEVDAKAAPADLALWWRQLGDPTLTGLVEKALAGSLDVRTAEARLKAAQARRGLAAKDLLPSVDASASGRTAKTTGLSGDGNRHDSWSAGLDASWTPDLFGGTRAALQAAQSDLEASEADLASTRVSLAAEVARTYVNLRTYQARLAISRDNLARQAQTLELTSWRAEAGLTTDLDVAQSRTNVEETRAQIPALETGLASSEHRLAVLLGQPPAALHEELAAVAPIPGAPRAIATGIPADTLRQRPDVLAAERRLAAATARVGQARAALYPSLRLSGSLGLEALTLGGLTSGETVVRSLLGSLTAPLFDRGRIRRQIEIQGAAEEEALATWERTILSALEEVENALVALASTERRTTALSDAAASARIAALLARYRYTAGLASYQTVLDTERTALSTEDGLKSSEADRTLALIRLYEALGGGWSAEPADRRNDTPRSEKS